MSKKKKIEDFLAKVEDDGGQWLKKARYRRANRDWLRKSQNIAIRVLGTLKERGIQQKELAEALDVSPQQVSKIVKGKQNLTLQTIAKLEQVLGISLIEVPHRSDSVKVESKKAAKVSYDKKSQRRYAAKEPLKNVVNSSWSPQEQKQSNLTLVQG